MYIGTSFIIEGLVLARHLAVNLSTKSFFFVAKPSRINHHMNSNDETWQTWHFVLCQELDIIKDAIGCTGTQNQNLKRMCSTLGVTVHP
jgi:hypothetical protein